MSRWPEGAVKTCQIEGCENTGKITRGMCKMHYRRWERGTLDYRPCIIEGCDKHCDTHKGGGKGMCAMHYRRHLRGRLEAPRYSRPNGVAGMNISFPYEVRKIDGCWHRRPSGSKDPWAPVVWPERDSNGQGPQDTKDGW